MPGVGQAVELLPEIIEANQIEGLGFDPAGLRLPASGDRALRVRSCARHVLSEAERVDEAEEALRAGDVAGSGCAF